MLTGAIVAPVVGTVRETELVLLFVICCCFVVAEGGDTLVTDVGFVVVVVCWGTDDDTDDVGGVAADDVCGFTVRGIPHIRDSVALTTFRLGLPGLHIFALISGDILVVVSSESAVAFRGCGDDCCCAYTWILLQIPKNNKPIITENTAKIKLLLPISKGNDAIFYLCEQSVNQVFSYTIMMLV